MGLGTADGVMVPVSVSAPHNSALTTLAGGGPSGFIEYICEVGARRLVTDVESSLIADFPFGGLVILRQTFAHRSQQASRERF
jgi:hypothetical protein